MLALFSDDVEYWETPFQRLGSKDELRQEWQAILGQTDIEITTEVYASEGMKHAVRWDLHYSIDTSNTIGLVAIS